MKRIRDRVAGLDVQRDSVVACCQARNPDGSVKEIKASFQTTRKGLTELVAFLFDAAVETVAMEAPAVYWKSPCYAFVGLFQQRCRLPLMGTLGPEPRQGDPTILSVVGTGVPVPLSGSQLGREQSVLPR